MFFVPINAEPLGINFKDIQNLGRTSAYLMRSIKRYNKFTPILLWMMMILSRLRGNIILQILVQFGQIKIIVVLYWYAVTCWDTTDTKSSALTVFTGDLRIFSGDFPQNGGKYV